ncbi:MAG: helix-turn-helix domain-containing protein [Deltaproteobacteria bacterium]|nr:helix-turn-helix domain-containing protein [Deltaproteobacteria bacterium]
MFSQRFGALLKRERELRGISLDEISKGTYIRREFLEAIEQNQLHKIPGLTFLRGFVKSYVRFVGLDDEEVQQQLKLFLKEVQVEQSISSISYFNERKKQRFLLALLTLLFLGITLRLFL